MGNYTDIDVCTCPEYNYTGGRCQPGSYCPEGSAAPIDCEAGSYCDDYELDTPKGGIGWLVGCGWLVGWSIDWLIDRLIDLLSFID